MVELLCYVLELNSLISSILSIAASVLILVIHWLIERSFALLSIFRPFLLNIFILSSLSWTSLWMLVVAKDLFSITIKDHSSFIGTLILYLLFIVFSFEILNSSIQLFIFSLLFLEYSISVVLSKCELLLVILLDILIIVGHEIPSL